MKERFSHIAGDDLAVDVNCFYPKRLLIQVVILCVTIAGGCAFVHPTRTLKGLLCLPQSTVTYACRLDCMQVGVIATSLIFKQYPAFSSCPDRKSGQHPGSPSLPARERLAGIGAQQQCMKKLKHGQKIRYKFWNQDLWCW